MMRYLFLLISTSFYINVYAHEHDNCNHRCNHRSVSGSNGVNYYQNVKMNLYDLQYMKLDLAVMPQSRVIEGSCTYRAIVTSTLDTFVIELKPTMAIDSIVVNGSVVTFMRGNDHVYIPFATAVPAGTSLAIVFHYKGTASGNAIVAGRNNAIDLNYTASLSEAYQAREWFPAKQLLNDKIDSIDMWFTTNAAYKIGSNGLLKEVVDLPNNRKQFRWSSGYPISYYLPSFAVGNYTSYTNYAKPLAMAGDTIPVVHYVAENVNYFNAIKSSLDKTPPMIEELSFLYGLYPFYKEKYGHKQAGIGGGMEHQTMSTMESFNTSLIAHELAHQWWGDNVTCATWSDIWINEGFASYAEYLTVEYLPALYPGTTPAAVMQGVHNSVMSSLAGSVYVPPADAYNEGRVFSGRLSYDKGSAIIHNLRFEMQSDTIFFRTLRTFQQAYKDSFATGEDFKEHAEAISGRNFDDFFNQWYYGQGYPTYNVTYGKQGNDLVLTVNQTTSAPAVTPFFKGLLELKINAAQGDTLVKINVTSNNQQFFIPFSKIPTGVEVDPNNWIINRVGSIVTGVDNIPAVVAGIRIYPNPTRGELNISLPPTGFSSIRIIDMAGRTISVHGIPAGLRIFNTGMSQPNGIYFVHISGKKGNVVERVLVSK